MTVLAAQTYLKTRTGVLASRLFSDDQLESLAQQPLDVIAKKFDLSALLQLALSRSREYSADIEAVNLTGDPHGLASALEKIEYYQGGWIERILLPGHKLPDPSLLRTHPQTEERIKRIVAFAGQTNNLL